MNERKTRVEKKTKSQLQMPKIIAVLVLLGFTILVQPYWVAGEPVVFPTPITYVMNLFGWVSIGGGVAMMLTNLITKSQAYRDYGPLLIFMVVPIKNSIRPLVRWELTC